MKAFHESAIDHIVLATDAADRGDPDQTKSHLDEADQAAEHHMRVLKFQGRHKDAQDYMTGINGHKHRIKGILEKRLKDSPIQKADKTKDCECKSTEPKQCNCSMMNKQSTIAKASDPVWDLKPKLDARYHYKKVHELHPDDQMEAQNKYSHHVKENMGHFLFPVDKESGRLAHAAVKPLGTQPIPKAQSSAYGVKELKPEHTKGATVRIHGPNTPMHGKLGIVQGFHPDFPGKIGVQVGPSQAHIQYVEPHHVHLSPPKTKVEKALVSLNNIRKAFMK